MEPGTGVFIDIAALDHRVRRCGGRRAHTLSRRSVDQRRFTQYPAPSRARSVPMDSERGGIHALHISFVLCGRTGVHFAGKCPPGHFPSDSKASGLQLSNVLQCGRHRADDALRLPDGGQNSGACGSFGRLIRGPACWGADASRTHAASRRYSARSSSSASVGSALTFRQAGSSLHFASEPSALLARRSAIIAHLNSIRSVASSGP